MPQALCLAHQLIRVKTSCPHLLFHDDRPTAMLPKETLHRLTQVHSHVYAASWLWSQANLSASPLPEATATVVRARPLTSQAGRRLFESGSQFIAGTLLLKLYLWALPPTLWQRIVYIDLDVLVQHNIDALLSLPFEEPLAAVHTGAHGCAPPSSHPFNSGLLVIKPSMSTLRALLLRSCVLSSSSRLLPTRGATALADTLAAAESGMFAPSSYWSHVRSKATCAKAFADGRHVHGHEIGRHKACEKSLLDQSLLNMHFRSNYHRLSYTYNAPALWKRAPPVRVADIAVLHFNSEPKPWSPGVRAWFAAAGASGRDPRDHREVLAADSTPKWSLANGTALRKQLWAHWLSMCEHHLPPVASGPTSRTAPSPHTGPLVHPTPPRLLHH